MFELLQIVTVVLVALGMTPALAHALELPGKKRLGQTTYRAMQSIYYPGFTAAGGIGEAGGIVATFVLLLFTPRGTGAFWLTLAALAGLLAMHAAYWVLTHPVNKFWVEGQKLGGFGSRFFSFASGRDPSRRDGSGKADWTALRDRWEY
jgi:hypothetical protein